MRQTKEPIEHFKTKYEVGPSGCWLWTGSLTHSGYGQLGVNGKTTRAHRFSYSHYKGEIGDAYVCHKCDNPRCVNPEHLFLGTQQDNLDDCKKKGRTKTTPDNYYILNPHVRDRREYARNYYKLRKETKL